MNTVKEENDVDYCGPEGNRLRAEAKKFGDLRHTLLDSASKAFENGQKSEAKTLSDQGKEAGAKMEEANKQAVKAILHHRNNGYGESRLDLHGLYCEEAMDVVKQRLDSMARKGTAMELEIITGAGNHSANGKALIKPQVVSELQRRKLMFSEKNAGSFLVCIEGAAQQPPSTSAGFATTSNTTSGAEPEERQQQWMWLYYYVTDTFMWS